MEFLTFSMKKKQVHEAESNCIKFYSKLECITINIPNQFGMSLFIC